MRGRFVFLFSAVLLSLALAAGCGDDDGDDPNGQASPNGPTPTRSFIGTVGEGSSPVEAIGTILNIEGLGGHMLDTDATADCPLEDVTDPRVTGRAFLGQFCLTFLGLSSVQGGITVVENMEEGGIWEFELSVEDRHWKVEGIEDVSDGS